MSEKRRKSVENFAAICCWRPCLSASDSSDLKIWSSENGRVFRTSEKHVWVAHSSDFQMCAACVRFQICDVNFQIGLKHGNLKNWKSEEISSDLQLGTFLFFFWKTYTDTTSPSFWVVSLYVFVPKPICYGFVPIREAQYCILLQSIWTTVSPGTRSKLQKKSFFST